MKGPCPYNCNNKTISGYCATTACIRPEYQRLISVVFCRECQYAELRVEVGFAPYFCNRYFRGVDGADYCSRGVRR